MEEMIAKSVLPGGWLHCMSRSLPSPCWWMGHGSQSKHLGGSYHTDICSSVN